MIYGCQSDDVCLEKVRSGKGKPPKTQCFRGLGVPGATRTRDLLLRRQTLYPTELQRHIQFLCALLEHPGMILGGVRSIQLS